MITTILDPKKSKRESNSDKLGAPVFQVIYSILLYFLGPHSGRGNMCGPAIRTGSELGELNAQRLLEQLDQRNSGLVMAGLKIIEHTDKSR